MAKYFFIERKFLVFPHCECGKKRNSLPRKFFSSNQLTVKFFSKTLIWRKIFEKSLTVKLRNFSATNQFSRKSSVKVTFGKARNSLSPNFFLREISSFVTSLVKTLLSRNFCQRNARVNFRNFHTVHTLQVWKSTVF